MAITLVQHNFGQATKALTSSITNTLGSNVTAGNCVVAVIGISGAAASVISSVKLGTNADNWASAIGSSNGTTVSTAIWVDPVSVGGINTVVTTASGTHLAFVYVYEFSGVTTSSPVDRTSTSTGTGISWTSATTSVTTQSVESWIGGVTVNAAANQSGPASPWTNETGANNSNIANAGISGYQITSSTGAATYAGTSASSAAWAGAVVTLMSTGVTTSTGSMSLSSMSESAAALGGNTTTSGAVTLHDAMSATGVETFIATGAMSMSSMSMAAVSMNVNTFPVDILGTKFELLLNGTWTDITSYVYQRNAVRITRGKPNETSQATPCSMTLTLNNIGGNFSPTNPNGMFYPYITRNTQIRVSILAASTTGSTYSGYRFWGEVSEWPPTWDPTGSDVSVNIAAAGVLRRYQQGAKIGSPLRRYITRLTGVNAPLAYWPCEDASGSTQFASALSSNSALTFTGTPSIASNSSFTGSDPLPTLNSSVWTGVASGFVAPGTDTYATPGTYLWTCYAGLTSVNVHCWGAGGGGGGSFLYGNPLYTAGGGGGGGAFLANTSYSVTAGNQYTVVVGAGGSGLGYGEGGGGGGGAWNGGSSSFDGTGVVAPGGQAPGINYGPGFSGAVVGGNAGGSGGYGATNSSSMSDAGAGGGSSAGTSVSGNNGSDASGSTPGAGGVAVTGGGAGGSGGSPGTGGMLGQAPGGGGGGAGYGNSTVGGNGAAGKVTITYGATSVPLDNVLRFFLDVPSGGGVNGSIYCQALTNGTIAKVNVVYGTGGTLQVIGYNAGGTALFTSTAAGAYNGVPVIVSVELTPSGTSISWALKTIRPGSGMSATTLASGTASSASIGNVNTINVNVGGTETGSVAIGHIIVQGVITSLPDLAYSAVGYNGELAGTRFTRLCAEQGVTGVLVGSVSDTPQLGPQVNDKFINVLQSIEDTDRGQLFEARDFFGLRYRTRANMQNQTASVVYDYSQGEIAQPFQPVSDDQLIRNDVTMSRTNGSSAHASLTTGVLSTLDPPNGVGDYTYSLTVPAYADSQLTNLTAWVLAVGTVNDFRYPEVNIDQARHEVSGLFVNTPALDVGDYFQITNPPSFLTTSSISQLAFGFSETINSYTWTIALNAVPESPYGNHINGDPNFLAGNWLGFNGSITYLPASSMPSGAPSGGTSFAQGAKYVNNGVTSGAMEESNGAVQFSALPSTAYQVDAWVYSSDTSVRIGFDWDNSGGGYLSTTATNVSVTANTWTKITSGSLTSNASAALGVTRIGTVTASGGTIYVMHATAYLVSSALPSW